MASLNKQLVFNVIVLSFLLSAIFSVFFTNVSYTDTKAYFFGIQLARIYASIPFLFSYILYVSRFN